MANRLTSETSPYLRQHADNPVRWRPWNAEALNEARTRDKPVLLSIGYSACHWCHVMAHECFEDEAIAALMNRHFVNIKVDREERPDLDRIYQLAHQALTGHGGGWPLTVFLTPDDLLPFFAGTYFPPVPRHGLPGFSQVLEGVARYYRDRRADIDAQNRRLQMFLDEIAQGAAIVEGEPDASALEAGLGHLARLFDPVHGGHRGAPKFPHAGELRLWLRSIDAIESGHAPRRRIAHPDATSIVVTTLDAMGRRGLYDHLGGGFFRYCVNDAWTIPHFEKMLYDNAQLMPVYAEAALLFDKSGWVQTVAGTLGFLERELRSADGAFYCALDADSPGGEGAYYVWTPDQVRAELTADQAELVIARYGLNGPPNFEGTAWHLVLNDSFEAAEAEAWQLRAADAALLARRVQRPSPARDDKVLTAWNALAIAGLARTARALRAIAWRGEPSRANMVGSGNENAVTMANRNIPNGERFDLSHAGSRALHDLADKAQSLADAALEHLHRKAWRDGRLHADDRARFPGYLDDYAFLLDALLEQLQQRWSARDAEWVRAIAEALLENFEDTEHGGFYFTAHDHERLPQRPKPWTDDALPGGNGVAARALLALGHLYGEVRWRDAAIRTLRAAAGALDQHPQACVAMLHALDEWLNPPEHVVVRAHDECALVPWRTALAAAPSAPRRCFFIADTASDLPDSLAAMAPGDRSAAYRCRQNVCSPAIYTPDDLLALYCTS